MDKPNTVTPISPVVVIPAPADPNADGQYDLPTLIRLGADKIQKASPRIPRDLAEQLSALDLHHRLTHPPLPRGLRVATLRREMKRK